MESPRTCIVMLCNSADFHKFVHTCGQLVTVGKYKGDICLIIGDDLLGSPLLEHPLIKSHNIIVNHFTDIAFTQEFIEKQRTLTRSPLFQYHKLHLFNIYFKSWNFIFYLDCGITIFSDIAPMLALCKKGRILAHSDAYPSYELRLHNQFDKTQAVEFAQLNSRFNLDVDYCQTTLMIYDTSIIEDNTFDEMLTLTTEYPISITNDQGVTALYFTNVRPLFEQIPIRDEDTYFYDYLSRAVGNKYIMLKTA